MALNTYEERRKYERLFPPSEHWIFYKTNGKRRGAYSKKIYKTKKSAEEQWGYDNSDPMYKSRLFKKGNYASRAWSRGHASKTKAYVRTT